MALLCDCSASRRPAIVPGARDRREASIRCEWFFLHFALKPDLGSISPNKMRRAIASCGGAHDRAPCSRCRGCALMVTAEAFCRRGSEVTHVLCTMRASCDNRCARRIRRFVGCSTSPRAGSRSALWPAHLLGRTLECSETTAVAERRRPMQGNPLSELDTPSRKRMWYEVLREQRQKFTLRSVSEQRRDVTSFHKGPRWRIGQ